MLEDTNGRFVTEELTHEPQRRVDVDNVVVGQLLPMKLLHDAKQVAIESRSLVGILSVAQVLNLVEADVNGFAEGLALVVLTKATQIVGNRAVVACRRLEYFPRQTRSRCV